MHYISLLNDLKTEKLGNMFDLFVETRYQFLLQIERLCIWAHKYENWKLPNIIIPLKNECISAPNNNYKKVHLLFKI